LRFGVDRVFTDNGIRLEWIEEHQGDVLVRVPKEVHPVVIYQAVSARIRHLGGRVLSGKEDLKTGEASLSYGLFETELSSIHLIPDADLTRLLGRIAIIIDDFGYHSDGVASGFIQLPFSITYAVIPGLAHSKNIANRLVANGKEFIIHMPMEAMEKPVESNGYELLVKLKPEQIRTRVRNAIEALPQARGLNNHMGSRATVDDSLLLAALSELKKANRYFIDSRTTTQTRAFTIATRLGVEAALNDTFLDNIPGEESIRQKLWHLADLAAANGRAIGIGHPHSETLRVLKQLVPALQKRGFQFVTAGALIRQEPQQPITLAQKLETRRN